MMVFLLILIVLLLYGFIATYVVFKIPKIMNLFADLVAAKIKEKTKGE